MTSSALPGFGDADLSNCEGEQIHLAGSIQPHGALLVLDEPDLTIVGASANAARFLALPVLVPGCLLADLPGTLAARVRDHLDASLRERPAAFRARIGAPPFAVDVLLHRPEGGGLVVEIETVGAAINPRVLLADATRSILNAPSLRALCDDAVRIVATITGYDRVMAYRFDDLGHGEVFAEVKRPDLEAFLGNRYPASDIPQIARRLYLQTRVRLLPDVDYTPVPILPDASSPGGRPLDMSLCALRSMSPIHLQYLKNMGVSATLVISLIVGGTLWGLIACHHYAPRVIAFAMRGVCEVIGEVVATRIAALESVAQTQSDLVARRLEQAMVDAIGHGGNWREALLGDAPSLLASLAASGAALLHDGQVQTMGDVPATRQIRALAAWLDTQPRAPTIATASLGLDAPDFAAMTAVAAGVLATPISADPGDYLVWFRPERVRTVTWGGDPTKPVIVGTDPRQLSPRLSFAQWHQVVENTADPWTRADTATARLIGDTIADMVLQVQSVRLLIAQNQMAELADQMRGARRPAIIAGADGMILLVNDAFVALLPESCPPPADLAALPALFAEPMSARRNLEALQRDGRAWRGEVVLGGAGAPRPFGVRAEAVHATLERKLGYMLHFHEIADRRAAEDARRDFQESMIDRRRPKVSRLDPVSARDYEMVLEGVVENAQLAALEITYGADADHMAPMLESVRASVARTADLLELLLWHAGNAEVAPD